LKDYLVLHSYFPLGTISTEIVYIIKYLLTHIPCCIFLSMLCDIFTAEQITWFILYCIILPYVHVMTGSTYLY